MIPYSKQFIDKQDIDAVVNVLKSDFLTQGKQVPIFEKIISKYMDDMDYTDFANGETRNGDKSWNKDDIAEYNRIRSHAQRIVDILTHED